MNDVEFLKMLTLDTTRIQNKAITIMRGGLSRLKTNAENVYHIRVPDPCPKMMLLTHPDEITAEDESNYEQERYDHQDEYFD